MVDSRYVISKTYGVSSDAQKRRLSGVRFTNHVIPSTVLNRAERYEQSAKTDSLAVITLYRADDVRA